MQMRELPRGRQYSIKGNVVNVSVEIQPVVDALPRPFDENVTVPVKLKKKIVTQIMCIHRKRPTSMSFSSITLAYDSQQTL